MTALTHPSEYDRTGATDSRGLRRDASQNRSRLLDAARTVFARNGLEAGVEEVARAAGVGIGTLYRRFPTKDALIAELVHELLQEVVTLAHRSEQVAGGHGLEQFLYAMGELQSRNRGFSARFWTDYTNTALRTKYRASLANLLADAKLHKVVRDDASVTDVDLLFWSLRGVLEVAGDSPTPAWRRQVAITLAGLRPSSEPLSEEPIADELVARIFPRTRGQYVGV